MTVLKGKSKVKFYFNTRFLRCFLGQTRQHDVQVAQKVRKTGSYKVNRGKAGFVQFGVGKFV